MENTRDMLVTNTLAAPAPESHPISHRRKIGAFYTPLSVTSLLCDWGIRKSQDLVLEPCFGGCTFLEASVAKLNTLGQQHPQKSVFGCDLDPLAFQYLNTRLGPDVIPEHFSACDFLTLFPENTQCKAVDFVVGNPPYIRYNKFGLRQKTAVDEWQKKYDTQLNGRSSLWAYFVLHALNFLKPGGRVAWVLPGSFLTAKYATAIRTEILRKFSRVTAITLTERLFLSEGTEEMTVILLAEGFSVQSSLTSLKSLCLDSITELKQFLAEWDEQVFHSSHEYSRVNGIGMVPTESAMLMAELDANKSVKKLGQLARIQIGVVTGNSKFFIKPATMWKELGIAKDYLQYIVPKSLWLQGICLNQEDASLHESSDVPCLALNSPTPPRTKAIEAYLNSYDAYEIASNSTFARRDPWYRFLDDRTPDAFLVFMTDLGPRIVVNKANANCTNSLYRMYFAGLSTLDIQLIAISLNSTFTQLSAELLGHGRGSGALKLEPSDAALLALYVPKREAQSINKAFYDIDKLIRQKKADEARAYADKYLFSDAPEFNEALPALASGLVIGRKRRMRHLQG